MDARDGTELLRHDLSLYAASGFVLAMLVRGEHGWQLREIADTVNAQHPVEAVPQVGRYLVPAPSPTHPPASSVVPESLFRWVSRRPGRSCRSGNIRTGR